MSLFTTLAIILFLFGVNQSAMVQQPSISDTFKQCLISQPTGSLTQCIGMTAISKLQSVDNQPEFDVVDGFTLVKDNNQEYRDAPSYGDPTDFRGLMDSANYIFGHRNMRWDMSFLYPGLSMRIAPSLTPGGVLEFTLDPHREAINTHTLKESSTGRILMRQFVVPFLMGFKFNIATIVPILFGILALIAKKAVIVSKLALIASSAFALGTLFFNNNNNRLQYQTYQSQNGQFNPGFGGNYNRYPDEEYPEVYYRHVMIPEKNSVTENANADDQLNLYANLQDVVYEQRDRTDKSKGRNFAWSEDEKMKKKVVATRK